MDFNLSFEQQALVDSLRSFVEKELYQHEDIVEELRGIPDEIATDIKRKAKEAGFLSMNMPAELGGGGLDYETLALVDGRGRRLAEEIPARQGVAIGPGHGSAGRGQGVEGLGVRAGKAVGRHRSGSRQGWRSGAQSHRGP